MGNGRLLRHFQERHLTEGLGACCAVGRLGEPEVTCGRTPHGAVPQRSLLPPLPYTPPTPLKHLKTLPAWGAARGWPLPQSHLPNHTRMPLGGETNSCQKSHVHESDEWN